ncbi:MAG: ABC transporter permease [Acidobacteria bacterium]|jgi:phospholipid/cholesterol/gamma-HCH transport system permease protein|nr:ABC transporter permease [Acidobacteriota bacterium]
MQKDTKIFVLPEKFSMEMVPNAMHEIKGINMNQAIEIDFKNTLAIDSAGIAFINYLKSNYPNTVIKNVNPGIEKIFTMFPSHASLEKIKKGKWTGFADIIKHTHLGHSFDHGLEHLEIKLTSFRTKFKTFFALLTDEIYYTIQFLFKPRGIYPGEIWHQLFFMAYKSYPIVSIISFLVGVTISITTIEQLSNFGADIYLADVVGFGMVRELVPLMTGIILAGKIGASITAEIASMNVLEETDALKTMGVIPHRFLMVPRLLGITMAIPMLVAIADAVGILGGLLVGKFFSGIPFGTFFNEMLTAVWLEDFLIGQMKTIVFGWIVVVSSGYKGFTVDRSPVGVGVATTESVVLSISLIIVGDCIFALLLY